MYNRESSPTLSTCTLSGNSANTDGGGVYNVDSSPTVTNCIFWNGGDEIRNDGASTPLITYCDIEGGYSGMGNIDADPLFVGIGDYHLQPGSPCIDAGENAAPSLPATDFEGEPRIWDGGGDWDDVVDMGVDEHFLIAPSGGSVISTYRPDDDVVIRIGGFPPGVDVEVTVVADYHWEDGDTIPPDSGTIFAQQTFTTNDYGKVEGEVIWYGPLELGEYDIAFDIGLDGIYDVSDDLIDDPNHPGFTVLSPTVGGEVYPVDKAALLMPWLSLGLVLVLAAGGLILVKRLKP